MASLTKEQKELVVSELSHTFGTALLKCDEDQVVLAVQCVKSLKYRVVMYINGYWKGEWLDTNKSFPEQKYLNRRVRALYSKAEIAHMQKKFGKRNTQKFMSINKTYVTYDFTWASGKMALNHLIKVSKSIELVKVGILDFEHTTVSEAKHESIS